MVMSEIGYNFSTLSPDIDEKAIRHSDPYLLPVLVARAKADALLKRVNIPALIITADQVVLAPHPALSNTASCAAASSSSTGGSSSQHANALSSKAGALRHAASAVELREKPETLDQARFFIETYSGKWIQTVSALVVHNTVTGARVEGIDIATVRFSDIPAATIDALLCPPADGSSPLPLLMHCAGAVQVENHLLEPYITDRSAPNDSIFGLPKELLVKLLVSQGAPEPALAPSLPHGASVAVAIAAHEGLE
jgi:septum formation protein